MSCNIIKLEKIKNKHTYLKKKIRETEKLNKRRKKKARASAFLAVIFFFSNEQYISINYEP